MRLYKFQTKYGLRVVGGHLGEMIRAPTSQEELDLHIDAVQPCIVKRAELEHENAVLPTEKIPEFALDD